VIFPLKNWTCGAGFERRAKSMRSLLDSSPSDKEDRKDLGDIPVEVFAPLELTSSRSGQGNDVGPGAGVISPKGARGHPVNP